MQRLRLRTGAAIAVTAAALAAMLLSAGSASAASWPDGPWSYGGNGAVTATSNGATSDPVINYSYNARSGSWNVSNKAKTARREVINWHYKGYHAWYQVTVKIEQYVIRNGQQTVTPLRSAGPVNCCAAPSGGFDYTGWAAFDLQPGDVYGFRMYGSNQDSDQRLTGTLTLHPPSDFSIRAIDTRYGASDSLLELGNPQTSSQMDDELYIASAVTKGYYDQPISLSVHGLPPGVTAELEPSTAIAGDCTYKTPDLTSPEYNYWHPGVCASSILRVHRTSSAVPGYEYPISVIARGPDSTHAIALKLNVAYDVRPPASCPTCV
jgi:hypothetical protein